VRQFISAWARCCLFRIIGNAKASGSGTAIVCPAFFFIQCINHLRNHYSEGSAFLYVCIEHIAATRYCQFRWRALPEPQLANDLLGPALLKPPKSALRQRSGLTSDSKAVWLLTAKRSDFRQRSGLTSDSEAIWPLTKVIFEMFGFYRKKCIFCLKNLPMSKKNSTFASQMQKERSISWMMIFLYITTLVRRCKKHFAKCYMLKKHGRHKFVN